MATNSETQKKIVEFFKSGQFKEFEKGQTIIYPAEENVQCYYLESGYVREYYISRRAEELTLHMFMPGSYFPMVWILSDIKQKYYYDALTDVKVWKVEKEAALKFIKENPDVLMELTQRLLFGIDGLSLRIQQLSFASARERVINAIIFMEKHFGEKKENTSKISIKLTHQEIAAFAALNRETATREINKLKKQGIISIRGKLISILDLQKLQDLVK